MTALTRPDSTSTFAKGVQSVKVDLTSKGALTEALRGQDALVITLSVTAPPDTHARLVEAAAAAGVPWILPNHWSHDTSGKIDTKLLEEMPYFKGQLLQNEYIASLGVSSYIAVSTGFWLDWSLAIPDAFGFDIGARKATFFDDGKAQLTVSTLAQVGRAVAALLSLPVSSNGKGVSLSDYRNQEVYVGSFTASQEDMLESLLRVTGTSKEEWTIEYQSSEERNLKGIEAMKQGDRVGFMRHLYSRLFYPELQIGNLEKNHGLINEAIGLPKEDIDAATPSAVERSQGNPYR